MYPEQYLAAARDLSPGPCVIGLRSIGTGLAALVASACDAAFVCTLRPVGDVYARTVAVGEDLDTAIRARRDATFALVDEGPGQSGSSLGGVADYLEGVGVARERIVFLPSHGGDLGSNAQAAHRHRWRAATRLTTDFAALFLRDDARSLPHWFEDVTGPPVAPLQDVSGGQWRDAGAAAFVDPGREARKYLMTTADGTYLLKFIGLDSEAAGKIVRARHLYAAGFSPEPVGWRYGFLAERWMPAERMVDPIAIWPFVEQYLVFRAARFPAKAAGASLATLVAMARYNLGQAIGLEAEALFAAWPAARVAALERCVRPVHVDARMHRWEWIATSSGILKTDAIDHGHAHDLVGCQDIAWDVAGAIIEWSASAVQRERLVSTVLAGRGEGADLTALLTLCYLGFQIGWWAFAADGVSAERTRCFYTAKVEALLCKL